jgi:acyl carrier protein
LIQQTLNAREEKRMEKIISQIKSGIEEVFPEVGNLAIDTETMLGQIPDWDSMAAINLQVFLEQQFKISVPAELLSEETTVGEIAAIAQSPESLDMAV